jgi:hypothetical protein
MFKLIDLFDELDTHKGIVIVIDNNKTIKLLLLLLLLLRYLSKIQ